MFPMNSSHLEGTNVYGWFLLSSYVGLDWNNNTIREKGKGAFAKTI